MKKTLVSILLCLTVASPLFAQKKEAERLANSANVLQQILIGGLPQSRTCAADRLLITPFIVLHQPGEDLLGRFSLQGAPELALLDPGRQQRELPLHHISELLRCDHELVAQAGSAAYSAAITAASTCSSIGA